MAVSVRAAIPALLLLLGPLAGSGLQVGGEAVEVPAPGDVGPWDQNAPEVRKSSMRRNRYEEVVPPLSVEADALTSSSSVLPVGLSLDDLENTDSHFWSQCSPESPHRPGRATKLLKETIQQYFALGTKVFAPAGAKQAPQAYNTDRPGVRSCNEECQKTAAFHWVTLSEDESLTIGHVHYNSGDAPHWQYLPQCFVSLGEQPGEIWVNDRMVEFRPKHYVQIRSKSIHMGKAGTPAGFDMLYWYHRPMRTNGTSERYSPDSAGPDVWDKPMRAHCSTVQDSQACRSWAAARARAGPPTSQGLSGESANAAVFRGPSTDPYQSLWTGIYGALDVAIHGHSAAAGF